MVQGGGLLRPQAQMALQADMLDYLFVCNTTKPFLVKDK